MTDAPRQPISGNGRPAVNETLVKSLIDVALKVGVPLVMVAGILYSFHLDRRDTLALIEKQHEFCTKTVASRLVKINDDLREEAKMQAQAILWLKEMNRWIGEIYDRFIAKEARTNKFGQPQPFPGATQRRLQVTPN